MPKSIISEGKTTNEAIEKGLKELHVSKNMVEIQIIEEKKKRSFFSILEPHTVKVELTVKEANNILKEKKQIKEKDTVKTTDIVEAQDKIESFLKEFLKNISSNITYEVSVIEDNVIDIKIKGEDSASLIGYRGDTLNALQIILSSIINQSTENKVRVVLDIGNYREKRKQTLEDLATKIEKSVSKTGKQVVLEPMSAYERKIIHTKLQESTLVKTYSIGEEPHRKVVINKK